MTAVRNLRFPLCTHRFALSGLNLERFMNTVKKAGIPLLSVKRQDQRTLVCECYSADLPGLSQLAQEKGLQGEFALYAMVERLAPEIIARERKIFKGVSPNVDFYSGLTYSMLGIPEELFTPIFAVARIVGWSAHRIEELICMDKIIRPAYMSVMEERLPG